MRLYSLNERPQGTAFSYAKAMCVLDAYYTDLVTTSTPKLIAVIVVGIILAVVGIDVFSRWAAQQRPKLPVDMPSDSVWIDAPALPFSWHHGWWFGCWIDSNGYSNRCRLWTEKAPQVVSEGLYVSCDTGSPVPADELRIKAPVESMHMWVGLNQNGDIAPAAFLQNGKFLVPVRAPHGCEDLKKNLALKH